MPSRFLRDDQLLELERNADWRRCAGRCPTCQDQGSYLFDGQELECELDEVGRHTQLVQFQKYCLSNIPHEFQQLDFTAYPYDFVENMTNYIEKFNTIRWSGIGYEFYGGRGVGKSWAATGILKELVNRGYTGWFMHFNEALKLHELHASAADQEYYLQKMLESEILVLDEILEPIMSESQRLFFESRLEDIIRYRTAHHFPTITTTNLVENQMDKYFPRVYSLLSAKQFRIQIVAEDYRPKKWVIDQTRIANGEVVPIY